MSLLSSFLCPPSVWDVVPKSFDVWYTGSHAEMTNGHLVLSLRICGAEAWMEAGPEQYHYVPSTTQESPPLIFFVVVFFYFEQLLIILLHATKSIPNNKPNRLLHGTRQHFIMLLKDSKNISKQIWELGPENHSDYPWWLPKGDFLQETEEEFEPSKSSPCKN